MWFSDLSTFGLGALVLATTTSGHVVPHRARAEPGECTFSAEPNSGDTCATFADWWGISLSDLKAYNPKLSCPSPDTTIPSQEWCVQMELPPATSTTAGGPDNTAAPAPSPTQENVTKDCQAWYKVVKGDGCQKVVDKYKTFTLAQFYNWNPDIGDDCSGLPLDTYVCVGVSGTPTAPLPSTTADPSKPSPTQDNVTTDCKAWYKVVKGDGCQKVVDKYKTFTLAQFYKWNPDVGTDCSGLPLDTYVCVGVTGTPTSAPVPSTTADPSKPSPTQDNVTKDCKAWYKVVKGDGCQKVVDKYKTFTLAQFYKWNPDVGTDCSGLPLDTYVCVAVTGTPTSAPVPSTTADPSKPSPTQENVTKDCVNWYKVVKGDGCQKVVDTYKTFTLAQFYKWNPDVGNDCSGLPLDTYVCVGVPGTPTQPTTTKAPAPTVTGTNPPDPVQTGVSKSCNKWYYVVANDGCQAISSKFSISLANFYRWNTAIKSDCSNLQAKVYVCVGSS
jgi:hypothetical protein